MEPKRGKNLQRKITREPRAGLLQERGLHRLHRAFMSTMPRRRRATSQSSSDASLTRMRNPAPKGTQATPLYEIGAKTPAETPKRKCSGASGRARLTWEWKGGPLRGGDSLRSQLGRKLSTVARGRARGRPRGAGAADSDTWCPDPAPRRAAVRSPQEGGRSSLGQSAGAQSTPKGMMALGRVRGTGTSPFGEPRLRHSARARVRTRTQANSRTRARSVQSGLAPLRAASAAGRAQRCRGGASSALAGRRGAGASRSVFHVSASIVWKIKQDVGGLGPAGGDRGCRSRRPSVLTTDGPTDVRAALQTPLISGVTGRRFIP